MSLEFYCQYAPEKIQTMNSYWRKRILKNPDSSILKQRFFEANATSSRNTDAEYWHHLDALLKAFNVPESEKDDVIVDVFFSSQVFGSSPDEYFLFNFRNKNANGRNEFLCEKERFVLLRPLYNFDRYEEIRNKWKSYNCFKEYFKRDCIKLENTDVGFKHFKNFIKVHDKVVYKPIRMNCGSGVELIDVSKYETPRELFDILISRDEGILDELIVQVPEMNMLNSSSINLVRMTTFLSSNGDVKFIDPFFSIGQNHQFINNRSCNSISAKIDADSGIVYTLGIDNDQHKYIFHPNTGTQIIGMCIPKWEEAKKLASDLIKKAPAACIGFDLVLSENGWCVIEMNPFPVFIGHQVSDGIGCKKAVMDIVNNCKQE